MAKSQLQPNLSQMCC